MTRTIMFNTDTRKWEVVNTEDETAGQVVIEQVYVDGMGWVTIPTE